MDIIFINTIKSQHVRNNNFYEKQWYPELEENVKNVPKIFVGNKIDLRDENMVKSTGKDAPISY